MECCVSTQSSMQRCLFQCVYCPCMHVHALLSERHACRRDCSRTTSRRAERWQLPKQALMRSAQQRRVHKTRLPPLQSAVTMLTLPQPRRARRRAARAASPRRTSKGPCRAAHSPARARARSSQPSRQPPPASCQVYQRAAVQRERRSARPPHRSPPGPRPAGARALVGGVSRKDAWLCWNPGPKAGQRSSGQDSVSVYR